VTQQVIYSFIHLNTKKTMSELHQLKGNWDYSSTLLYMKAMFCYESHYLNITEESIDFLNQFESMGYPFSQTNYQKINNDFKIAFTENPARFVHDCLKELKQCNWPTENKLAFIEPISAQIYSGYQLILLKVIGNYFFANNEESFMLNYTTDLFQIANSGNINYFATHILLPEGDRLDTLTLNNEFKSWSEKWLNSGEHTVELCATRVVV
jgi:hypothetical protein